MPRKRRRARLRDLFAPPCSTPRPDGAPAIARVTTDDLLDGVRDGEVDVEDVAEGLARSDRDLWRLATRDLVPRRKDDE